MSRMDQIELKIDEHIHEGIKVWKALEGVKTDVQWLRKAFWVLATGGVTFNVLLAVYVIERTVLK